MNNNRELQLGYTDSWQNLGTLMRNDADYANGQLQFEKPVAVTNRGASSITIKGIGKVATPAGGSGITIQPDTTYVWEFGFNAGTTYVKGTTASETGNFEISFYI